MSGFSQRLSAACNQHSECPTGHGSAAWLRRALQQEGIDVSGQCVSNWQNGKSKPRDETLEALCRILNVTPAWLLGLTNEANVLKRQSSAEARALRVSLGGSRVIEITQIPSDFTQEEATRVSKLVLAMAS